MEGNNFEGIWGFLYGLILSLGFYIFLKVKDIVPEPFIVCVTFLT